MKVSKENINNISDSFENNAFKLIKKYSDYYIGVISGEYFDEICCYDYKSQLLWKQRDKDPESGGRIVDFIKVNTWIKVFYSNGKVIRIRAESSGYSACGIYIDYGIETFDNRLNDFLISGKTLIYNNINITVENAIDDIKLYNDSIFILANSKGSSCPNNWLTLYSYDFSGNCKWIIEDYSNKIGRKTSRIDYFGLIGNQLYADTFDSYKLYINIATGKVEGYTSFAKFK